MNIGTEFLSSVIKRFGEYKLLAEKTFERLNEKEMRFQPNIESNSIAIIIQHLAGNMESRWTNFLTEDGEKVWRKRDEEFEVLGLSKKELLDVWSKGWKSFLTTLESLKEEDLLKIIHIRNQPLIVIDAINRQMAHYSYHTGQIVYLGRWLKGKEWKSLSIPKKESN